MKGMVNIFYTLRHLKMIQVKYQIWYRLRSVFRRITGFRYPLMCVETARHLQLEPGIPAPRSFENYRFTFLNDSLVTQQNMIPWNDAGKGKLWAYNLNYMDYLLQEGMDAETGLELMKDFAFSLDDNKTGREPYTIALRGINQIKFICRHYNAESVNLSPVSLIRDSLNAQYRMLMDQIEYHLMGNHLLEDAFSLLFGALFFDNKPMFARAKHLLLQELEEQVLPDGAHFELSPMYHQIILNRLLDSINLLKNNPVRFETQELLTVMKQKAVQMLGWLNRMTFPDGTVPFFNDAAPGIAPTTNQLNAYAHQLISEEMDSMQASVLRESNYRRFDGATYHCIVDVGGIAPDYQPGHAHADSLSLVLQVRDKPVFIDPGVSTYQQGEQRARERSTAMHNTVTVNNANSSAVWSAFRVGKRAQVSITEDTERQLTASHNGYRSLGTTHERSWQFNSDNIIITDTLRGNAAQGTAHFWFHPDQHPVLHQNTITTDSIKLVFEDIDAVKLHNVSIPDGYNLYKSTVKIEVFFVKTMKTNIFTP